MELDKAVASEKGIYGACQSVAQAAYCPDRVGPGEMTMRIQTRKNHTIVLTRNREDAAGIVFEFVCAFVCFRVLVFVFVFCVCVFVCVVSVVSVVRVRREDWVV